MEMSECSQMPSLPKTIWPAAATRYVNSDRDQPQSALPRYLRSPGAELCMLPELQLPRLCQMHRTLNPETYVQPAEHDSDSARSYLVSQRLEAGRNSAKLEVLLAASSSQGMQTQGDACPTI